MENKELSEKATIELLKKYFTKSNIKEGEYYYFDRKGKRHFYNLIRHKMYDFRDDVILLGKDHIRINIKMIDKRPEEYKSYTTKCFGHLAEDINMTIFDLVDNICSKKYDGKRELLSVDTLKCVTNRLYEHNEIIRKNIKLLSPLVIENIKLSKDRFNEKDSNYINIRGKKLGELQTELFVYLGCEVIMEVDFSWLDYFV